MKKLALLSALSLTLLASLSAYAADTVELKVNGAIRPAACLPSFTGGGTVDYGTILAKDLPAGKYKTLVNKEVAFAVNCDAPTRIAMKVVDNRASSVVADAASKADAGGLGEWDARNLFGLGTVAGKNVGSYVMTFKAGSFIGDSNPVVSIATDDGGATWAKQMIGAVWKGRYNSWTSSYNSSPTAYKQLTGIVVINAVLNKPENLPLAQEIPLDGSATIEVIYL